MGFGLALAQKRIQADLKRLGDLISLILVGRGIEGSKRSYRYRVEFKNATVLQHFVLDEKNKVAIIQSEGSERKPNAAASGD